MCKKIQSRKKCDFKGLSTVCTFLKIHSTTSLERAVLEKYNKEHLGLKNWRLGCVNMFNLVKIVELRYNLIQHFFFLVKK